MPLRKFNLENIFHPFAFNRKKKKSVAKKVALNMYCGQSLQSCLYISVDHILAFSRTSAIDGAVNKIDLANKGRQSVVKIFE